MSKISHCRANVTKAGQNVQRAIEHSPELGDARADGSPSGQLPPGGFMTG